ncbi:STAS domain-containing protein [Kitasatospora sp. NPDC008115]|uniref:STAS domain-containing protein n=1 Tax=Kitasatospora sp. NPDC008115 TaxID=3364022 RepID=UPI0036E63348
MSPRHPLRAAAAVPGPLLRITTAHFPDGAEVVRLDGTVDYDQRARLHDALDRALDGRPHLLVVDLSHLLFCDSTCLNELLRLRLAAQAGGTGLVLAAVPAQARRLLDATGTNEVFTVRPSVRAALASTS